MLLKKTETQHRIVILGEWLLALAILAMLVELSLIYQHSTAPLPEVRLIERSEVTVAPPITVKTEAKTGAQATTSSTNSPSTFVIPERKRSIPPLLAFENIRRMLGLLGPEDNSPETYTLTRSRSEKTLVLNDKSRSPLSKEDQDRMLNGDNAFERAVAETNMIQTGGQQKKNCQRQAFPNFSALKPFILLRFIST